MVLSAFFVFFYCTSSIFKSLFQIGLSMMSLQRGFPLSGRDSFPFSFASRRFLRLSTPRPPSFYFILFFILDRAVVEWVVGSDIYVYVRLCASFVLSRRFFFFGIIFFLLVLFW